MIIYGKNSFKESVSAGIKIQEVFVQNGLQSEDTKYIDNWSKSAGIKITTISKQELDKKSNFGKHQGIVAIVEDFQYSDLDEVVDSVKLSGKQLFLCLLDGIEDPHNLGSIIRSAECAGVQAIVLEKQRACDINATVMKVSAGALNYVKIVKVTNMVQTIEKLKKTGVWVYACELGGQSIYNTDLTGDIAIVIGSEGKGVGRLVKENCDIVFSLPMKGNVNSLNASNAAAITFYEAIRQRD